VISEDGQVLGQSKNAAVAAVSQVVPSRVLMAVPGMFIPPVVMSRLEKTAFLMKNPWLKAPTTILLTGICLSFSTPLCCALFPQKATITLNDLEPELQTKAKAAFPSATCFYYNKGL
jgi:hypothetical protein